MRDIIKSHYKSFSKFSAVGVINTILDLSVFILLYELLGFDPVLAHICAFFVAVTNSFIFNSLWTFKKLEKGKITKMAAKFFIIAAIGLMLSTAAIYMAKMFVHPYIAKLMATFVSFSWNYIGSWMFVFKD